MNPDFAISVPFVLGALKNNIGKALITLLITLTLAALAMIFLPRSYLSEAIIFVRLGRESVSLDPTATTGSMVQVLESRESEVNSIRDMLTSREVMENIVDTMGPEVILGDEEIPEEFSPSENLPEDDYVRSPRQQAIQMLGQEIYVISERKSSVLKVGCQASSPELARRIVQVYLDCYKSIHTQAHQTPESNEFFEKQSSKKRAGVVSIQGAQDILKEQVSETQLLYKQAESRRSSSAAKVSKLGRMYKNPLNARDLREELITAQSDLASTQAESKKIRNQLRELKKQAEKLNHDEVEIRQLEQEVAIVESNIAQYGELQEQTRIEEALLSSKFTNVKIIQEPSYVPKSVTPKKKILAMAGLVCGCSGAFLVAILWEIFFGGRQTSTPSGNKRSFWQSKQSELSETELIQNLNT